MTCWNNLDINEFCSNGNNDTMECVTSNKSSLFAPRPKALEKQGKNKYPCEARFIFKSS